MDSFHASPTSDDLSALAWVHEELRKSLDSAHKALNRCLKESSASGFSDMDALDPAVLRTARQQIHQGVGALELSGLTAGATLLRASEALVQKFVNRPQSITEEAVRDMLSGNAFGDAGARVVIEEFLEGEEASFIVMCDGKNVLALATSQDHKRLLDGDLGPNTGGMGAYSPAPVVTPNIHAKVMQDIIRPTVDGMRRDGIPFTGFLYAGLMIDAKGGVKTLEF